MIPAKHVEQRGILLSLLQLLHTKDNIKVRNTRLRLLKYMLIFPLAPVFANMQGALFSDSVRLWGLDAMTILGSAYCFGAGALFALTNQDNMAKTSRTFGLGTGFFFLLWLFMPESQVSLLVATLFMLGLGGCAACAAFAYTFALNNTERLLGAALISLFFALNQLDSGLSFVSGIFPRTYLTSLVLGTVICLFLYTKEDFKAAESNEEAKLNPALLLTLYFFVAHYFVEIFFTYLPGAAEPRALIANGAVGIFAVCLTVALQLTTNGSIWNMCNLFFVAIITTYLLHFLPADTVWRSLARSIHGFEQIGYIAAYYLLGCVFKKHGNFRLFKLCLVTILPLSMVSYLIPGTIVTCSAESLPLVATLTTGAVFAVFIFLSPAYSKYLFYAEWSDDFYAVDMSEAKRRVAQVDTLANLELTMREKEIATLLLYGKSAKDIAEELEISVHTVNFHIKNVYKKMNINKRSEFFARLNFPDS